MIKPTKPLEEYEKYGFRKCKDEYGKNGCYYLCVRINHQMIFLTPFVIEVFPWAKGDPRVHKNPDCRLRDYRTALDIICEMAIDGLIKVEYLGGRGND